MENWIQTSRQHSDAFAQSLGQFHPEELSGLGLHSFDPLTATPSPHQDALDLAVFQEALTRAQLALKGPICENLRKDLEGFAAHVGVRAFISQAHGDLQVISFENPAQFIHDHVISLWKSEDKDDRAAGIERLHRYVAPETSFTRMTIERLTHLKQQYAHPLWPAGHMLTQSLKASGSYVENLRLYADKQGILAKMAPCFRSLCGELDSFCSFVTQDILPLARESTDVYPLPYYQLLLQSHGVTQEVEDLMAEARIDFDHTHKEWDNLAKIIAKEHKLTSNHPRDVFTYFRSMGTRDSEKIKNLYGEANRFIHDRLRELDFYPLPPHSRFITRLGTAFESRAIPYPDLRTPKMLSPREQTIEFVLPDPTSEGIGDEDYSYPAAVSLLVHEGWPGHALQMQSLLEAQTSHMRKGYLINSAATEGWAVYGERLLQPYLPLEAQFIAVHIHLWRCARAFLEPQIYLRKITLHDAKNFLCTQLGISEPTAQVEINRYAFLMPGQAPSYYFGYKQLEKARKRQEQQMGQSFSLKAFHKSVLDLGFLPLTHLSEHRPFQADMS